MRPMEEVLGKIGKSLGYLSVGIMKSTTYFGIPTYKCPIDAWVYQQIIYDYKPDTIIEIGNKFGGSALMMAHWLDKIGHGNIIGVDVEDNIYPLARKHKRITFITGDGVKSLPYVERQIEPGKKVLLIEDSSHLWENTLRILRAYSPLIQVGGYMIVEDSVINHGLARDHPGPYKAIEDFLAENSDFVADRECEQFVLTWNPKGYLKRIAKTITGE